MPIDKSWTFLRNRLSDEYWNGLSAFIEVAKNYQTSLGHISCPCMKCRNHLMHPIETVRAHIHRYGFDPLYRTWIHHGEVEAVSGVDPIVNQPVDKMFAPLEDVVGINDDHRMLDETHVARKSYSQHRNKKASTETQELMSAIDNWADMHRRGASWVNTQAEQTFNALEKERQKQRTQSTSSSTRLPLDEHGILEKVFGKRRGHKIGVGPMLSQKRYSGASPSSADSYSNTTSSAQPDPRMSRYLKKSYREQMKIYDNQVKMLELMSKLQPNIKLPTIDRPKPVDLDVLNLPSSDDNSPDDDLVVGDVTNLDD